jgi:hypothetical protein
MVTSGKREAYPCWGKKLIVDGVKHETEPASVEVHLTTHN